MQHHLEHVILYWQSCPRGYKHWHGDTGGGGGGGGGCGGSVIILSDLNSSLC